MLAPMIVSELLDRRGDRACSPGFYVLALQLIGAGSSPC